MPLGNSTFLQVMHLKHMDCSNAITELDWQRLGRNCHEPLERYNDTWQAQGSDRIYTVVSP